ncbi:MAG: hypothetical protein WCN95_10595 [bacterium]
MWKKGSSEVSEMKEEFVGNKKEKPIQLSARRNFAGAIIGDNWVATFMVHLDCLGAILTMQWNQQPIKVPKGYCPSVKDVQEALRISWRQKEILKPSGDSKVSRAVKVAYHKFFLCLPAWRCRSMTLSAEMDPRGLWLGDKNEEVRIEERHVKSLEQKITTEKVSPDLVVVDFVPQGYTIDDGTKMLDPIGAKTRKLRLDAHVLVADRYWVREILSTLDAESVNVDAITSSYSTASELLTDAEQAGDTVVIDIGARNTYLGFHNSGSLCAIKTVEGGADGVIVGTARSLHQPISDVMATIGQQKFSLYSSDAGSAIKDSLFLWRTQVPMIRNLDNAAIPVTAGLFNRVWTEIDRQQAKSNICIQNAVVIGDDPLAVRAMLAILKDKTALRCRWGVAHNHHKHAESDSSGYAHMVSLVRKHGREQESREELKTKASAIHRESAANKLIEKGISALMAYVGKLKGERVNARRRLVLDTTYSESGDIQK